jgi:hypothetical protein
MSDQVVIVTMKDVRAIEGCSRGARDFCRRYGIDWTAFLDHGVDARVLEATGQADARQLTAYARQREAKRG